MNTTTTIKFIIMVTYLDWSEAGQLAVHVLCCVVVHGGSGMVESCLKVSDLLQQHWGVTYHSSTWH